MNKQNILLQASGITKRFNGVVALNNVGLTVRRGEVNVLLGENGAGKSTLVKIISGVYAKDEGEIWLEGQEVHFRNVRDAQEAGISIIHQELNLLPERTIAQNIFVGREPVNPFGLVDYKKMVEESKKLLRNVGLHLDPNILVKKLSIAQQQMIEIAKALSLNLKLLIMDEPTSSLTTREIDKLFEIIDRLTRDGIGIIYISHRMDEIRRVGDRLTILRDGEYIDTMDAKTADMDDVVSKMVGRKIEHMYHRNFNEPGKEILRTERLTGLRFRNVSISIREGEVVSLAGLVGSGRTEVAKAIFGYDPIIDGKYYFQGKAVSHAKPDKSVGLGIAFLPEDRKAEGLHLKMPIRENIISASLKKLFPTAIINKRVELAKGEEYCKELKIATPNADKLVGELSGGNQQKVVVSKWLLTKAKLFIFDEPTRGIDVGAKAEIYQLLDTLAANGAGILMISSEMNEVVGLSDRVYVMNEGEVVKEIPRGQITQEKILFHALNGSVNK